MVSILLICSLINIKILIFSHLIIQVDISGLLLLFRFFNLHLILTFPFESIVIFLCRIIIMADILAATVAFFDLLG